MSLVPRTEQHHASGKSTLLHTLDEKINLILIQTDSLVDSNHPECYTTRNKASVA